MSPEVRAYIEKLEARITALERVENVAFIESLKRRGGGGLTVTDGASATGTTVAVRNASDTASETVADDYAGVLTLTDATGATYRIGYY